MWYVLIVSTRVMRGESSIIDRKEVEGKALKKKYFLIE